MSLGKFPLTLPNRIKQFLCKHELTGKVAYSKGINSKEGYMYVFYECRNCNICYGRWDKKEDIEWVTGDGRRKKI